MAKRASRSIASTPAPARSVPLHQADSLHNLLSGMGGSGDHQRGALWVHRELSREQIEAAYRNDWIARKIIDIPAFDATRSWRDWQADADDITAIEKTEKALNLKRKTMTMLQKARLYGGAAFIIGVDQGKPEDPIEMDKVKKGALKFVHAVTRWDLSCGPVIQDITSPWFGEPEYYTRNMVGVAAAQVKLHPSRVVRMFGLEPPDIMRNGNNGWGDSIMQVVSDAIKACGTVANGIAQLVDESKLDVIRIPGLTANINSPEYEKRLRKRFGLASDAKSIYRMLLLDKEEEWQRITMNFGTLPDILQVYLMMCCGAGDIPSTRMMSESPKGLNATGASDIRNYYDMVNTKQNMDMGPALERLDEVVVRSALGTKPEELHYLWTPLWQMTEAEQAEVAAKKAATFKVDVDASVLPTEVLLDARLNQLYEDGTYPGLETIVAEYEAALEAGLIEPNVPVPQALDPVTGLPLPPPPPAPVPPGGPVARPANALPVPPAANNNLALARRKAVGDAALALFDASTRIRRFNAADAKPRTLYVRRDVLNHAEIAAHFKKQGFLTTVGASMHVTIAFSRVPLDWMKIDNDTWNSDEEGKLRVKPGGVRLVEKLGDATALLFTSTELQWRWERIKCAGADWSHPEYQPHITITWDENVDTTKFVEPWRGAIQLGPEVFNELNEDWKELLVEDAKRAKYFGT